MIKIPKGNRLAILLLALIAVFIGSLALVFNFTDTSFSCNLCHSMKPEHQAWQKSSHAKLPCMGCHTPPGGAVELITEHIIASKFVPAEFITGYHKPINAESEWSQEHVEVEQCTRCHSPETRNFTPRTGINMDGKAHSKHLKAGLKCSTCHNRIAHKSMDDGTIEYDKGKEEKEFKYKDFMTMKEGCWRCHNRLKPFKSKVNGAVAPAKCSTCHTKKFNIKPDFHSDTAGKPFIKRHGKLARADLEFCQSCHENKGEIGKETGIKTCYSCHKVEFPHDIKTKIASQNWSKNHYKVADRSLCLKCHQENAPRPTDMEAKDPDFCQKCHHRSAAKDASELGLDYKNLVWKKFHFKIVREKGSEDCFQCHKSVFCAQCHVRGKKPAPGIYTEFNKNYWSQDYKIWSR